MILFTVKDGEWKVTYFIAEHNHELASKGERHFLRSHRNVSNIKGNIIDSMVSAGISTISTSSYMAKVSSGTENVGFTKQDCYNYGRKQNHTLIVAGDAQSLLQWFKKKKKKKPDLMLYHDEQLDQEGWMTNWFLERWQIKN